MIALLLFILGLYCYEIRQDRVSFYLILQFLALSGYSMLLWDTEIVRMDDLALLMVLYSFLRKGIYQNNSSALTSMVYSYLAVISMSALVSFLYYQIPAVQIFKGARAALYILVFFDLKGMTGKEFEDLFFKIFILSSVASLLYCLQVLTGVNLTIEVRGPGFLGFPRSFNYPPLIAFNCLYAALVLDRKYRWFAPLLILSFMTLFVIQSRGMIMSVLLAVFAGISLKANKSNRILISILALGFFVVLITNLIFSGEAGDNTLNDFSKIASGEFASDDFEHESNATFTYRLNLLAICIIKTFSDPIRFFFGSGLLIEMPYSFFERWDMVESCFFAVDDYTYYTPDISFSNIIYNIGFFGAIVYTSLVIVLLKTLMKWADGNNTLEIVGAMLTLYLLLIALDSSILTWPNTLVVPFLFAQYVSIRHEKEPVLKLLILLFLLKTKILKKQNKIS